MGISLAKITDFFGLADEDMYEEAPAAKQPAARPTTRPVQKAPVNQERKVAPSTYQTPVRPKTTVQSVDNQGKRRGDGLMNQAEKMPKKNEKVVSMPNNHRSQRLAPKLEEKRKERISVVEPRAYSEAMSIAKRVGQGEVVLINFQSLDEMKARRVVDFLTGAVFMVDGDIKRVGNEMFLCTPTNVEITNSTLSSMVDEDIYGLEM